MASKRIWFPRHGTAAVTVLAAAVALALVVSLAGSAKAVNGLAGVYTSHYDNQRTGADLQETTLNPSTVNEADFGKIASIPVDGKTYAQPLYVQNLNMGALGTHDVVFVVTEHDSVYAFDADGGSNTPLWKDSFIDPGAGINPIPAALTFDTTDIAPEIGITGTPVIDPSTNTIYLVAATDENGTLVNRLHALDITSGAERPGSPVVINPTVPGTGVDAVNGMISFNNVTENQRPGLALANGELYVAFSNHGFHPPYHGWMLAFNPSTLHQDWVFCTTPNAQSGGIWMGGDGIPIDGSGNIYFSTGNGTFDENSGGGDYGDSFVKLSPSGNVTDYFTPYNYAALDSGDTDLAAGGVLLLPDQSGPHPHEALVAGKGGTIYVVDRDDMGHVGTGSDNQIVQSLIHIFPTGDGYDTGNYSSPVYFNGAVFYGPISGHLMRFSVTNGLLSTSPTSTSSETFSNGRGSAMTISANGANDPNGILWALQTGCSSTWCPNGQTTPGVLHAYLASNLGDEIWNSNGAGSRDTLGPWEKFSPPLVANGRVYVAGVSELDIYGLLNAGSGGGGGGSGGGGSSGGGSSGGDGGTADLSVTWTSSHSQIAIGGVEDLTATIANKGTAGSTQTHFRFSLPTSVQLVGPPYYEYGSGCTGSTAVDCFLDAIGSGVTTKVVFEVRAVSAGTASITGSLTDASDANAADNTATVSFQVESPAPPPPPPAKVKVTSVQIVTVNHVRYVVVRVSGSTRMARIHVALLDKKHQTLGDDLTRYVATNKTVRVGNLRLGKSVASVKVTLSD